MDMRKLIGWRRTCILNISSKVRQRLVWNMPNAVLKDFRTVLPINTRALRIRLRKGVLELVLVTVVTRVVL